MKKFPLNRKRLVPTLKVCKNTDCAKFFSPFNPLQEFCSIECKRKWDNKISSLNI